MGMPSRSEDNIDVSHNHYLSIPNHKTGHIAVALDELHDYLHTLHTNTIPGD